jgi:hypothetical protein
MPSCAKARPTWVRAPRVRLLASLRCHEIMAAAIGIEAARQTVLRDHLVQRAQGRVRALFGDQKGRIDLAGGIVQRHDQVERRLAVQPFVPRTILMQHHAAQRPARPLAAMGSAPRCRGQKTLAVQKRLGPGVAPIKAVHPDQPLVEMLGGEPAIARPVQLSHPLGFRRRDPTRRRLAQSPVNHTGFAFFLKPPRPAAKRPLAHPHQLGRLELADLLRFPSRQHIPKLQHAHSFQDLRPAHPHPLSSPGALSAPVRLCAT